MAAAAESGRSRPKWPGTALRVSFVLVCAINAVLDWLPGFRSGYLGTLMGAAKGQPGWLGPWFGFWVRLQRPRVMLFAYLVAVIATLIAAGVVLGLALKLTYLAAAVFNLLIWSTAQGFGGPYDTGRTGIGTGIIYAVLFLALSVHTGPPRLSADHYLEQKIGWWQTIAEVRPAPSQHGRGWPSAATR